MITPLYCAISDMVTGSESDSVHFYGNRPIKHCMHMINLLIDTLNWGGEDHRNLVSDYMRITLDTNKHRTPSSVEENNSMVR